MGTESKDTKEERQKERNRRVFGIILANVMWQIESARTFACTSDEDELNICGVIG